MNSKKSIDLPKIWESVRTAKSGIEIEGIIEKLDIPASEKSKILEAVLRGWYMAKLNGGVK